MSRQWNSNVFNTIAESIESLFVTVIQLTRLNIQVSVAADKIQTSDRNIFTEMQTAINEFLNNRKWTGYHFTSEERVECSFYINITERPNATQFKGTLQIQVRRPIFNSTYNSSILNYIDRDIENNMICSSKQLKIFKRVV